MIALIVILLVSVAYYLGVYVERTRWKYGEHEIQNGVAKRLVRDQNTNYRWENF